MKDILVSIITVCFNSEKTIERTIQSVLAQTYPSIEYIIIDGKSTDRTMEIVNRYSGLFGQRMTVVSEKDNGIYDAMNKGIRLAKGELIGIINSDDYYETDAVETMVAHYTPNQDQILYGVMRKVRNGVETQAILTHHQNLKNVMIPHPTCFVSCSVYTKWGAYDTRYRSCADYELMVRMSRQEAVQFVPVYHLIATFCEDGGMSSHYSSIVECLNMKKAYGLLSRKQWMIARTKAMIKRAAGSIR